MGIEKKDIATETLLFNIIEGIRKVKGKEIIDIDLTGLEQRICQHFLICHGDSNTHVNAIAESVESEMREKLDWPSYHREGFENASWILLDYGAIVVHVFQKEYREFYRLEELWADGVVVKVE